MNDHQSSRVNQILDLLVEEIEERMRARRQPPPPAEPSVPRPVRPLKPPDSERHLPESLRSQPDAAPPQPSVPRPVRPLKPPDPERHLPEFLRSQPDAAPPEPAEPEPEPEPELPPLAPGPSHAARLMGRLALGLLVIVVLINIPFNRHGTTLATSMPDSASLVIREGLVVKEENDEEIYVYQDDRFRWISSLDAFEHFGFTWGDVHIVEDGFLEQFEKGTPLHVLLKCRASPHIYRLEGGKKRWIVDIATFEAEGHVWEDVRFVDCSYLRRLPDGETIPPGSGPPPQP